MSSPPRRWLISGLVVLAGGTGSLAGPAVARRSAAATTCPRPSVPVPRSEPKYTPGPTELVSGLYIQGGAIPPPPCRPEPRGPYAGRVMVTSARGNATLTRRVKRGHLAHIQLPPGSYTVQWKFSGHEARPGAFKVQVYQGEKVRQDGFLDVP